MAEIDAQRPAMGRQFLDVEDFHAVQPCSDLHRKQRKIREVLVVDRVELVLRDQGRNMRKLQRHDALGLEDMLHAAQEIVDIGDLCQHVVGDDEVCLLADCHHIVRKPFTEEGDLRRDISGNRHFGDIDRRLDA